MATRKSRKRARDAKIIGERTPQSTDITVTKLDAALRQLRVAIRLWFADDDPVAIHALAFAAHEIIHRLFKLKGLSGLMFDSHRVKNEYRGEFARTLKADAGFFKHADTDPDGERGFNPLANDLFIVASLVGLDRMDVDYGEFGHAFMWWLHFHEPQWFTEDLLKDRISPEMADQIRRLNRGHFLEYFLEQRRIGGFGA